MDKILIFGHKKPDTDSVTSAISLSYLKNALGFNTEAMVLGEINNETKFVLNYFKVDVPKYLNDVKLQIKNLEYSKCFLLDKFESIYNGYNYMDKNHISTLPITENNLFIGAISMKDIALDLINGKLDHLYTSYENIIDVLHGEQINKLDDDIEGNIIVAGFRSTTFIEQVNINNKSILIVGDRHSVIEYAIMNNAKLLIITGNNEIKDVHLQLAKEHNVNIIRTCMQTFEVTKKISLCNYIANIVNKNVITFNENDDVADFIEIANRTKKSNYPVINNNNGCLGFLKLADVSERTRKQVILVDHNEYEQSVDGLDEADIVEIIDHHKIGTIGTTIPINFRNMPVGSTNTIISIMFKENGVEIPNNIAGLMLSGILSDTLLFKSPTTTPLDKKMVDELSTILNIDYNKYASEMFKSGSSLAGKTLEEILYSDFKNFTIDNKKIGIGQISTVDISQIQEHKQKYIDLIESIALNNNYYIIALFITDIINDGSYILFNHKAKDVLENSFNVNNLEEGHYFNEIVSRKKQIIPAIMNTMDKKN